MESSTFDFVTRGRDTAPRVRDLGAAGCPGGGARPDHRVDEPDLGSLRPGVQRRMRTPRSVAATELYMYATTLAEQRRTDPRDDIVTRLITEVDDDALGAHEFEMFVLALAVAGNETTRTAISQGTAGALIEPSRTRWRSCGNDPGAARRPRPRRSSGGRPRSSTSGGPPRVTSSCTGRLIRENDPVALFYMSANYDETVFADPPLVRHLPFAEPARLVRRWRPALLSRGPPRPPRDPGAARGAHRRDPVHRARRRRPTGSARAGSTP